VSVDGVGVATTAALERCLARVGAEYAGDPAHLGDQRRQDAIVLNLLRACETAIDLAMHEVARQRLGTPESSRSAFALLRDAGVITPDLADALMRKVGLRNLAVYEYQQLDLAILRSVIEDRLDDFRAVLAALGLRG